MDKIKNQLNVLIEYYRNMEYEHSKNKEFSKELFSTCLIDHQIISICSATTYRKLAAGESLKNDDIYIQLLNKMGLKYNENAYVYKEDFEEKCIQICSALERMDFDEMFSLLQETIACLMSEDIIENEYRIVLSALYDMTLRERFGESKDMQHILNLFAIYNEAIKQCLTPSVYNFCAIKNDEAKIPYYLAQVENTPFHRTHVLYYWIDISIKLDDVEIEMTDLLNYYEEKENYHRMLELLIMKMKYYYWLGKNSDEAVEEIEIFMKQYEGKICLRMKKSYLYYLAKKFNREKNYIKARDAFEQLLDSDSAYIAYILTYYFHCLIMLDEPIKYDKRLAKHFQGGNEVLYQYFEIPKNEYVKREKYILEKICIDVILNQEFLVKSFLYELRKIVKVTKHYRMLDQYLDKTDVFL